MRLLRPAALSSLIVLYVACQVNARAMISAETKLDLYMIATTQVTGALLDLNLSSEEDCLHLDIVCLVNDGERYWSDISYMSFAEAGNVYTNPQACGVYTMRVYPSNA